MKSLTPNVATTSVDFAPQYPSLDAAVEVEQVAAPTLTNLLAANPQAAVQIEQEGSTAIAPGLPSAPINASTIQPIQPAPSKTEGDTQAVKTETESSQAIENQAVQTGEEAAIAAPETEASSSAAEGEAESEGSTTAAGQDEEEDFDRVTADGSSDRTQQVLIKREDDHVAVLFPKEGVNANPDIAIDFTDSQLWQDLQQRLSGGTAFADNTPVHLYSQNYLLDTRQLQELGEALGRFNLKLVRIITSRRQTAVAAAMSGYSTDQTNSLPELLSKEVFSPQKIGLAEPLYLQKTIRSGTEIRHPGSVIIMGDLNPGSSVIADGDILIWGRLRGVAHAGAAGKQSSIVMALKLEAPQLRIASAVARVAAQGKTAPSPEIAYVKGKDIRITSAYSFNRSELG